MMMTQVFRGRTLDEAKRAAEGALGRGAVVVTTRSVRRNGVAGLFGARDVEVAAASPEPPPPPRDAAPFAAGVYQRPSGVAVDLVALRAELRSEMRAVKDRVVRSSAPPQDVLAEIAALREALEQLAPTPKGDRALATLKRIGVEGGAVATIARALKARGAEHASTEQRLRDALADVVRAAAWPLADERRSVIAVVGPAGVGKTTTAAKLAAHAVMDDRSVTLVACDAFRVGAVDQLMQYAELLGAKFARAHDANDLAHVIGEATTDVVIVDTSGRAPSADDTEALLAAHAFAQSRECAPRARHVLLCVPASLRAADASRVARGWARTTPTAIAVTKLDETDAPAGLVHASAATKLPVSVLCFGQRVPEDIGPATTGAILERLVPLRASHGSAA